MTDPLAAFDNITDTFNGTSLGDNETFTTTTAPRGGGPVFYFPWNNPENIIKEKVSDDFAYGMQCVIFPILTVFGLTGNIMSLIVLTRKQIRNSTTSIVLIGLSISDMGFLITNMSRKSTCIIAQFDELKADTWNAVSFRYIFYLRLVFSRISTLLIVVIALERFVAVAFPLKVRVLINKTRMIIAVVFCYFITFAGIAGIPPQYTYRYLRGTPVISQTEFALNNVESLKIYNEYFLAIFYRYIPVVLVLLLTLAIIVLLSRSQQFKKTSAKGSSNRNDEQRKITRTLLTVAVIYLVCLIPGDAVLIASDVNDKFRFFGNYHNLFLVVSDISLLFELFNSSINFIIYMVLNKNFFSIYVSLFCGRYTRLQQRRLDRKSGGKSGDDSKSKGTSGTKETKAEPSASQNEPSVVDDGGCHTNQAFENENGKGADNAI